MPAKIAHIAIDADDTGRAIGFYQAVFGWQFKPWGPPNFFHIQGAGIHGALQERQDERTKGRDGIECTFAVRDLSKSMADVEKAGGKLLSAPFEIKDVGVLAKIEDTERNRLVLMEYEPGYARSIGLDPQSL